MSEKFKKVKPKNKWKLIGICKEDKKQSDTITGAHIEIFGTGKLVIEGCLGVYEYKDTYIKLRLSKGTVIICGSGFNIVYFENKLISISGSVSALEFI